MKKEIVKGIIEEYIEKWLSPIEFDKLAERVVKEAGIICSDGYIKGFKRYINFDWEERNHEKVYLDAEEVDDLAPDDWYFMDLEEDEEGVYYTTYDKYHKILGVK